MNTTRNAAGSMMSSLAPELPRQWGWMLALGICLVILGVIAVVDAELTTIISMVVFGWILVIAGIIGAVQAIRHRGHSHLFLYVLNAVLSIVVGVMLLRGPATGAVVLTMLLATYFVVAAVFRIVMAFSSGVPNWGWMLFDGVVTLILGILIWAQWPVSGLWVIGLFIGIDLIIVGWSQAMMAMALRAIRNG